MYLGPSVAHASLAARELAKVSGGLGTYVVIEPEDDAAGVLVVDGDVELERRGQGVSFAGTVEARGTRTYTSGLSATREQRSGGGRRAGTTHGAIRVVCGRQWHVGELEMGRTAVREPSLNVDEVCFRRRRFKPG